MKRFTSGLLGLMALMAGHAHAQSCGDLVSSSITLSRDLTNCPDTGLLVIQSGVTIRLNGHSIDGVGNSSGIGVISGLSKVRILGPGTIRQFGAGIALNDGQLHQVRSVTLDVNDTGIHASDVADSIFSDNDMMNGINGLTMSGTGSNSNLIADNFVTGMSSEAIWLDLSSKNQVEGNYVIDNQTGIAITSGSENLLTYNRVIDNINGITIAATTLASQGASENQVVINKLYGNRSAIYLSTYGTSWNNVRNRIEGNAIRDSQQGLLIGDPGNIKTITVDNWFNLNTSFHIQDLGSSSLFSGNHCDGLSCP